MNEAQWLASDDPQAMLDWYRGVSGDGSRDLGHDISDRKLRLFAVACLSRCWAMKEAKSLQALLTAERYADGCADTEELRAARSSLGLWRAAEWAVREDLQLPDAVRSIIANVPEKDSSAAACLLREIVGNPYRPVKLPDKECWDCRGYGNHLGAGPDRGNPECDTCRGTGRLPDRRWLTPTVLSLAQAAYDERLPDGTFSTHRLAILADALEEAGCMEESLLRHLRGWELCPCAMNGLGPAHGNEEMCGGRGWIRLQGPHVCGCWSLDLLTGRS
jgi:hypothetical protein